MKDTFATGAQRDTQTGKKKYTLVENTELATLRDRAKSASENGLIDHDWWHAVELALKDGATRYGHDNWRKGFPFMRCVESLYRHIQAFLDGDRGEDHLANASCNLMFLHWLEAQVRGGNLPATLDDRPSSMLAKIVPQTPVEGTREWARQQFLQGHTIRTPYDMLYRLVGGVVECRSVGEPKWTFSYHNLQGVLNGAYFGSGTYSIYKDPEVGSSKWALAQIKAGKTIAFRYRGNTSLDICHYTWDASLNRVVYRVNGRGQTFFEALNGPGCKNDHGMKADYGKWEIIP